MLVLRKDISEKIKSANLLVVNVKIFNTKSENFDYGDIWRTRSKDITSSLAELGVKVIGYKPEEKLSVHKAKSLGIELAELNGNRKLDILSYLQGKYSFKDMVFIGDDIEDLDLIKHSRFSVTTSDAPLELKMESQYVSNFSGLKAFEEIGNIIINAKRDNQQHKGSRL